MADCTPLQVLDTLSEVAFCPEFLSARIEKERKAVLAEAQMMNTIEYRVDCALLKYLHEENALGARFPIGKTDQVPHSLGTRFPLLGVALWVGKVNDPFEALAYERQHWGRCVELRAAGPCLLSRLLCLAERRWQP